MKRSEPFPPPMQSLSLWIVIIFYCCCHNAVAFAFTKIPDALIDERQRHQERLPPCTRLSHNRRIINHRSSSFGRLSARSDGIPAEGAADGKEGSNGKTLMDGVNQGPILLGIVALLYGSLNVSLRFVYDVPDVPPTAAALSATRGWLAFFCFLPPLMLNRVKPKPAAVDRPSKCSEDIWSLFVTGLELALWNFFAQGLLNVGLVSTGSARASFLTQTSVLFTPLISTVLGNQKVGKNVWLGCIVALVGLVVLTVGGGATTAFSLSVSTGDLFVLGGALSWSMYLFRISFLGPKHPDLLLQGVKTGLLAVIYSIWWITTSMLTSPAAGSLSFSSFPTWMTSSAVVWIALFFSAIGPGTVADVLQQKGQKYVSPSEANILLSAEPVFATLLAVLLLGETSSLLEIIGGGCILIAAVIASSGGDQGAQA